MKIICVGLNYKAHNEEMGRNPSGLSSTPVLFLKPDTALLTDDKKHFYLPDFAQDINYEAEVVIRIDKMGKNIAERFAHRYYSELTIGLDLTARDLQEELKKKGLPWEISKGFDNSAILGRMLPVSQFDVNNLDFSLKLNGKFVQVANTSQMIHSVDKIVAYASQFFTLKTGDLIFTGTPAGVDKLAIGDVLEGYIGEEKLLEAKIF